MDEGEGGDRVKNLGPILGIIGGTLGFAAGITRHNYEAAAWAALTVAWAALVILERGM